MTNLWMERNQPNWLTRHFDFTSNNQYIASSSMDKTVRIWEISKGLCIRVIYGLSPQLCIRFHPVNNNFISVGNANKEITIFNFFFFIFLFCFSVGIYRVHTPPPLSLSLSLSLYIYIYIET
ncbi:hypothetical protein CsSME_00017506 [Camellia sinensis var. sinensis]